jgi:hypothetical protein
MTDFKVGDRVQFVKNEMSERWDPLLGKGGTVTGAFDLETSFMLFPYEVALTDGTLLACFGSELTHSTQ